MCRLYFFVLCLLPFSGFSQAFTEVSFAIGKGYLTADQAGTKAYSLTLKRVLRPLEDVYISYGAGGTRFAGAQPFSTPQADPPQQAAIIHAPIGAGYACGGDKLVFTIGADVMPSYYLFETEKQFVVGFSPNFSISRKLGKTLRIGLTGKVVFLPPAFNLFSFTPTFAGGGVVLQGW